MTYTHTLTPTTTTRARTNSTFSKKPPQMSGVMCFSPPLEPVFLGECIHRADERRQVGGQGLYTCAMSASETHCRRGTRRMKGNWKRGSMPLLSPGQTQYTVLIYTKKRVWLSFSSFHTHRYYYAGFQHKDYVPLFPSSAQFVISSTRFSVATANEHVSIWGRSALPTTPNCRRRRVVRNSATRGGSRVVQTRIAGSRIGDWRRIRPVRLNAVTTGVGKLARSWKLKATILKNNEKVGSLKLHRNS